MGAAQRMNLKMVHVLTDPPHGWQGEKGFITADVMERYLGSDRRDLHYSICGPIPMITAVENDLKKLGIPLDKIHTENYEMA
jgi:predicted ferric reductase